MLGNRGKKIKTLAVFTAAGLAVSVIAAVIALSKGNAISMDKALRDLSDIREDIRKTTEQLPMPSDSRSTRKKKTDADTDADSVFRPIFSHHFF